VAIPAETLALLQPRLVSWRRALHRCPEVGIELPETIAFLQAELRAMGLEPRTVGLGFVVDLGERGPRVAWRVDMDALPIQEETGASYASEHPGQMHACGHDAHMAVGLGLAWVLSRLAPQPAVRLIFQPDEEGQLGAPPMIEAGVLEGVSAILGVHVGQLDQRLAPGQFAVRSGAQMAAGDRFWALFKGRGTHGAMPHLGRDPLVAAAAFVGALQALAGRTLQPGRLGLVSVGRLRAGDALNIIPERAEVAGIVRTEHPQDQERLVAAMEQAALGTARTYGVEVDWTRIRTCAPVLNDPGWSRRAKAAITGLFGPEALLEPEAPSSTSDDIGFYQERVPGVYAFLGTHDPGRGFTEPNHSPRFDLDETQLWKAVAYGAELLGQTPIP
jgi:amidohydrolase